MHKYKSFMVRPLKRLVSFIPVMIVCLFLCTLTCITRDNQYDPINQLISTQTGCSPDGMLTKNFQNAVKAVADKADTLSFEVQRYSDTLTRDSLQFQGVADINSGIRDTNQKKKQTNLAIESANKNQTIVDSLRLKLLLDTAKLPPSVPVFFYSQDYQKLPDSLDTLWKNFRDTCPDAINKNRMLFDSLDSVLARKNVSFVETGKRSNSIASRISIEFSADTAYNDSIRLMNASIGWYNDSIRTLKRIQGYTQIKTIDSLRNSLDKAKAGDTLVLMQKNFTIPSGGISGLKSSGDSARPIVILGDPQGGTVISTQAGVVLSNNNYFSFYNIRFTGSDNSGFKAEQSNGIKLSHCSFDGNKIYGVEIVDSRGIWIDTCTIFNNGKSGIRTSSPDTANNPLNLTNILIVHNGEHGIWVTSTPVNYINLTVSNNGGNGLLVEGQPSQTNVWWSLLTFNGMRGISFPASQPEKLNIIYSDIFGNDSGAVALFSGAAAVGAIDSNSYYHVNPPYADTASRSTAEPGNFSIVPGGFIDALQQQTPGPIVVGYREKR